MANSTQQVDCLYQHPLTTGVFIAITFPQFNINIFLSRICQIGKIRFTNSVARFLESIRTATNGMKTSQSL